MAIPEKKVKEMFSKKKDQEAEEKKKQLENQSDSEDSEKIDDDIVYEVKMVKNSMGITVPTVKKRPKTSLDYLKDYLEMIAEKKRKEAKKLKKLQIMASVSKKHRKAYEEALAK